MFRFPWANKDELDEPDKCAVCWDKLDKARKLPCSHMFHQLVLNFIKLYQLRSEILY